MALTVLLTAACKEEPTPLLGPEDARSSEVAASDGQPFYYYDGQPQYLVVDSVRVVFSPSEATSVEALRTAAQAAEVDGVAVNALHEAGHFVIEAASAADTDSVLKTLRSAIDIPFSTLTYRTKSDELDAIPLNRLALVFEGSVPAAEKAEVIDAFGLETVASMNAAAGQYWHEFRYPEGSDPLAVAQSLYEHPTVEWADPVMLHPVVPASVPNDPYYSNQWYLKNDLYTWDGIPVDINIEQAWEYTTGQGINVVVIDDGIDAAHEDLNIGSSSLGYDVTGGNGGPFDPGCKDNHGTQVAGIIAAQQNNLGGAGIAPAVVLHSARIFHHSHPTDCLDNTGSGDASSIAVAEAIDWARSDADADVMVAAWHYPPHDAISSAISRALSDGRDGKGTAIVAARGNNELETHYPARLSSFDTPVISASAIDWQGITPDYIAGPGIVDVVAPSGQVLGCAADDDGLLNTDLMTQKVGCGFDGPGGDQDYTHFSGTSGSTAQVAGIAALIIDRRNQDVTAGGVRGLLRSTATAWGNWDYNGRGKVNATLAVLDFDVQITGPDLIKASGDYTWHAEVSGAGTGSYRYTWYRRTHYVTSMCELIGPWAEVGTNSSSYTNPENSAGYDFQLRVKVEDLNTGIAQPSHNFKVWFENHPPCPY